MTETAAPSRWLLIVTALVVVVFTALRIVTAATLDLRSDEAYYWTWSHQAVLSFLDQPPMVAWFERLGQAIFGDTPLGARFAQLVSLALTQMLLADIARRRTGRWNAALVVVLATEAALDTGFFSIVVEPSIPLLLFTSLLLWALCRLDATANGRWWLLVGVAGGLALLSKYLIVLLVPALLVFVLLTPAHRCCLTTIWPYLATIIALAVFSPVLIWNAQHGWVSFAFQGTRLGGGEPLGVGNLFRFGLYETIFVGLVLLPASIIGAIVLLLRALVARSAFDAALATAFLFPLAAFLVRSLTSQINQSWPYFLWPLGALCLSIALPWPGRLLTRAVIAAVAITGLPLVAAAHFHASFDRAVWLGRGDPLGQDAGYAELAEAVLARARTVGATWIATSEYRTYANLNWHIGGQIPVVQINEHSRFLDFTMPEPKTLEGRALYVHYGPLTPVLAGAALGPSETIEVSWRGAPMQQFTTEPLDGFTPDLHPPPGSPADVAEPAVTASSRWVARAR